MKFCIFTILTLFFSINISAQKSPIVVYLAGDSTMAEKAENRRPETGWGEKLQQYFDAKKVKIDNRAQNGRSTKSFIDEGRWKEIVDNLKRGDYVFIEFGHNDEKTDKPAVYAAANTDYQNNLIKFVTEVRFQDAYQSAELSIPPRLCEQLAGIRRACQRNFLCRQTCGASRA